MCGVGERCATSLVMGDDGCGFTSGAVIGVIPSLVVSTFLLLTFSSLPFPLPPEDVRLKPPVALPPRGKTVITEGEREREIKTTIY